MMSALMLLTACDPEDSAPIDDNVTNCSYPKTYNIIIGTSLNDWSDGKTITSNPTGSVRIKSDEGGTFMLRNKRVSLNIGGDYVVKGPNGEYNATLEYSTELKTNGEADFMVELYNILETKAKDEKVIKLTRLQVVLTALEDGETYQKVYNFSNASIWDMVTGIGTIFGDLNLSEVHTNSKSCSSSRWLDIDGDIILTRVPTSAKKAKAKSVTDSNRLSGKEVESKPSSVKSKSSKGKGQ